MGRIVNTNNLKVDIDDITFEDMPNEVFEEIFTFCGKDVAISLMEQQAGVQIFVPARPFFKLERRLMLEEYKGTNSSLRNLARKYKMTEASIREWFKKSKIDIPVDGQLDMFSGEY